MARKTKLNIKASSINRRIIVQENTHRIRHRTLDIIHNCIKYFVGNL